MQCSKCKYPDSKVVYSDYHEVKNLIKRRRECLRCGARFTTHEHVREDKNPIYDKYEKRSIK